jgi:iron complex transport system ATP-binding protein
MNAPVPLLETRDLEVRIGRTIAVRGFDFRVAAGDRVAVLGCNGVGKSTLLAALAGLLPVRSGEVLCSGRILSAWPAQALACHRGWLAQNPDDPFAASVLEAVLVGRHPWLGRFAWEGAEDRAIASAALQAMGLAGFEARNVQTLSGGERQRVAIAALLAQSPQLYLLDEPLSHLDLASQIRVLEHFQGLAQAGAGVVLVAHDLNLALRWANRLLLLYGNGEWAAGPLSDLANAGPLTRALGHPLRQIVSAGAPIFVPA